MSLLNKLRSAQEQYFLTDDILIYTVGTTVDSYKISKRVYTYSRTVKGRLIRKIQNPSYSVSAIQVTSSDFVIKVAFDETMNKHDRLRVGEEYFDIEDIALATDMFTKEIKVKKIDGNIV
jgi:hypothetical protein